MQGIGGGEGAPNDPEMGFWQSSRIIVPQTGSRCARSGRWGTAVPGTHWREGEAGHNVFWRDLWERLRAHQPYSMKLQSIAQQAQRYPEMVFDQRVSLD